MTGSIKPFIKEAHFASEAALFSTLLENSNEVILLLDANGHLLFRSPSAERITGLRDEQVLNLELLQSFVHPHDRESLADNMQQAVNNPGKTIPLFLRAKNNAGHYMYYEGTVQSLLHDERIKAIIFNVKEVTDYILKEQQLRLYVAHSPAAIAMFDKEMRYMVVSRRWLKDYKMGEVDVIGKYHYEVFPNISAEWRAVHQHCLKGHSEKSDEDSYIDAEGKLNWLRWEITPWYNAGGDVGGIFLFTEDITQRKEAEEKLAASEKQYRTLVERISDGFIALDEEWNFVYVNSMAKKMFGDETADVIGKNIWDVFPGSMNGPFYTHYWQAMNQQEHVQFESYSLYAKLWLEVNVYPSQTGLSIYFRDITKRIEAQAKAESSEVMRKSIMGTALDAIICVELNGEISFWNTQAEHLFGWKEQEVIGKPFNNKIVPPRYRGKHRIRFGQYNILGQDNFINRLVEVTAVNKQGKEFPIELFIVEITDRQLPFYCAFIRDITDRKQKERELLQTNTRLKEAQQIAHVGGVVIDYKAGVSQWSEEALRIYGIDQEHKEISLEEWLSHIHPDDLNDVKENIAKISPDSEDLSFYHRIIRNGEIRYLLSTSRMEYDENNRPGNIYGVIHDITNIKKLEQELLEQQAQEQLKITAAILKAQEKERNAIGQELHDNINQILTGIKLQLSRIRDISDETKLVVDMSTRYLAEAINENRKIARELTIPDFINNTLVKQLHKLTGYMLNENVKEKLIDTATFDEDRLTNEQKLTVYRVLQEQCTNITKYANAASVNITLSTENGFCKMNIADDGVGMSVEHSSNGIGLRNIKSRLSMLKGDVSICTSPGKGFALEIGFPTCS